MMSEAEVRWFAVRRGAKGGMIAALVLCLVFIGLPAGFFTVGDLFGDGYYEWGGLVLLMVLLASIPVTAIIGALGGGILGLACNFAIVCAKSTVLASMLGAIIGAIAGLVAQGVVLSIIASESIPFETSWLCAPIVCPITGIAGLIIAREIARDHP